MYIVHVYYSIQESLTSIVKVGVAGDAGLSQENDGFWEDSHDQ